MATPCKNDNRFIGTITQMREAAPLCETCPVRQECLEAGIGEPAGVRGGLLPSDPLRVAAREARDRYTECRNGHPTELYGLLVETGSHVRMQACSYCGSLLSKVAAA